MNIVLLKGLVLFVAPNTSNKIKVFSFIRDISNSLARVEGLLIGRVKGLPLTFTILIRIPFLLTNSIIFFSTRLNKLRTRGMLCLIAAKQRDNLPLKCLGLSMATATATTTMAITTLLSSKLRGVRGSRSLCSRLAG